MGHLLTSWKEIAAHFGKGVRTVQRWEGELGLPVRRPTARLKKIVLADREELDSWLRTTTNVDGRRLPTNSELEKLRLLVEKLQGEIEFLRQELQLANTGELSLRGSSAQPDFEITRPTGVYSILAEKKVS